MDQAACHCGAVPARTFEADCYQLAGHAGSLLKDTVKNLWSCKSDAALNGVAVTSLCALGGLVAGTWGAPLGVAASVWVRGEKGIFKPFVFAIGCGISFKYLLLPLIPVSSPVLVAGATAAVLTCAYKGDAHIVRDGITSVSNGIKTVRNWVSPPQKVEQPEGPETFDFIMED